MSKLDPETRITLVETLDEALDFRSWLSNRRDFLACDLETSGVNLGRDKIRLCQFGDLRRGWAIPWDDWRGVVKETLPAYRDSRVVFHNATFDLAFLRRDGVPVREELVDDTMIMGHLHNPAGRIGLKPLAAKFVGPEALMGKGELEDAFHKYGWDWGTVPIDYPAYWHYAALDTQLTAALADELWPTVRDRYKEIYEVELACIHVLIQARLRGMRVDLDYTHRTKGRLLAQMAEAEHYVPFAPSKDAKAREYFEQTAQRGPLGAWWPHRTDKGEVSMDDDALKSFEHEFPDVIPHLRRWRKDHFLVSHYLDSILRENVDGVLRCNVRQVLRTGRMSITDPALQTLPRGTEVRDAFVAREGHKIVLADYQQAELRVFAWYSQCRPMIEAFKRGEDLHGWVAAQVYHNGDQTAVTKTQRQVSKNTQFATLYGAGNAKIALTAGVEVSTIDDFRDRYNALFPEVPVFMQSLIKEMHRRKREEKNAYAMTRLGRRLIIDPDKLYAGVNALIQGTATGDVLKLKIAELDAAGLGEYLRLPIHDELLFEVPDEEVPSVLETINEVMPERRLFGDCTLTIDTDVCSRWGDHYREAS